ncbi:hypothetical protein K788_0003969 [Paraburkholderia caribensis MBA4]|uniref:Uncharacterized protein n=1 Tax=Paraburkholderia caribensis MBA4 TaxID=1323664 RepID=A0A0P0R4P0_9BURK|nr:hypothetical protein K788_0003969 [Paraburkholderia caribensis MBA4]
MASGHEPDAFFILRYFFEVKLIELVLWMEIDVICLMFLL